MHTFLEKPGFTIYAMPSFPFSTAGTGAACISYALQTGNQFGWRHDDRHR